MINTIHPVTEDWWLQLYGSVVPGLSSKVEMQPYSPRYCYWSGSFVTHIQTQWHTHTHTHTHTRTSCKCTWHIPSTHVHTHTCVNVRCTKMHAHAPTLILCQRFMTKVGLNGSISPQSPPWLWEELSCRLSSHRWLQAESGLICKSGERSPSKGTILSATVATTTTMTTITRKQTQWITMNAQRQCCVSLTMHAHHQELTKRHTPMSFKFITQIFHRTNFDLTSITARLPWLWLLMHVSQGRKFHKPL